MEFFLQTWRFALLKLQVQLETRNMIFFFLRCFSPDEKNTFRLLGSSVSTSICWRNSKQDWKFAWGTNWNNFSMNDVYQIECHSLDNYWPLLKKVLKVYYLHMTRTLRKKSILKSDTAFHSWENGYKSSDFHQILHQSFATCQKDSTLSLKKNLKSQDETLLGHPPLW